MDRNATVSRLIEILVQYVPGLENQIESFSKDYSAQRALLRGLMNMHAVKNKLSDEFYLLQDRLLQDELKDKKIASIEELTCCKLNPSIYLYKGDITSFKADAIVNSASDKLLGCFEAGHNCIDNKIHSASGLQLRFACDNLVNSLTQAVQKGNCYLTDGYNLPSKHIIHAVAPKVLYEPTKNDLEILKSCYLNIVKMSLENNFKSIAVSSIATDAIPFAKNKAISVAVTTVKDFLEAFKSDLKVVFIVDNDKDYELYDNYLNPTQKKSDPNDLRPFFNLNLI